MGVTLDPGSPAVVVVSGIPASGKTTLARSLGERLGVSVMSEDTIKEVLFDALGSGDLARPRELGPLALPGSLISVATSAPVDVDEIRAAIAASTSTD